MKYLIFYLALSVVFVTAEPEPEAVSEGQGKALDIRDNTLSLDDDSNNAINSGLKPFEAPAAQLTQNEPRTSKRFVTSIKPIERARQSGEIRKSNKKDEKSKMLNIPSNHYRISRRMSKKPAKKGKKKGKKGKKMMKLVKKGKKKGKKGKKNKKPVKKGKKKGKKGKKMKKSVKKGKKKGKKGKNKKKTVKKGKKKGKKGKKMMNPAKKGKKKGKVSRRGRKGKYTQQRRHSGRPCLVYRLRKCGGCARSARRGRCGSRNRCGGYVRRGRCGRSGLSGRCW